MTDLGTSPVLIAYATKHGSTREVAEFVAGCVRRQGAEAEVRDAAQVDDLTPYGAVILGGSLYIGRWHRDAIDFLRRHRNALEGRPLAIFALGPTTSEPGDIEESQAQLDRALAKVPEIRPDTVTVFGGVIDPSKLRFPLNRLEASDARNWQDILAWAAIIGVACGRPRVA